jgi:dipeptidyl aminopeptidase/acylaminoacyl peptidase
MSHIKMPVTLIIQGTVDPVVPINQSTEFQNQLVKLFATSRLEKIIGAGHDLLKGAIASKTRKLILDFLKNGV